MRLYIAGPMTGYPNHNFTAFDEVRDYLLETGHSVVSPADISRASPLEFDRAGSSVSSEHYAIMFRQGIEGIFDCEGLVLLDGWTSSRGAKLEVMLATVLCKRFFHTDMTEYKAVPSVLANVIYDGEY